MGRGSVYHVLCASLDPSGVFHPERPGNELYDGVAGWVVVIFDLTSRDFYDRIRACDKIESVVIKNDTETL